VFVVVFRFEIPVVLCNSMPIVLRLCLAIFLLFAVFGMTGHVPDFGMLMIGANAGIVGMTKEHLGLALALR
jgi:hypothetical protein